LGSGVVVKERVVLTAAHVVFDDSALALRAEQQREMVFPAAHRHV